MAREPVVMGRPLMARERLMMGDVDLVDGTSPSPTITWAIMLTEGINSSQCIVDGAMLSVITVHAGH